MYLPMNVRNLLRTHIFKNMFLYFRILKIIFFIKWKNRKLKARKSRESRKSRKNNAEFSILPYSQNRKLGFEIPGKKFPRLPSFRPGPRIGVFQLTLFKSLPSCYLKPTLNLYNFTSFLSAWNLFVILP